MPKDTSEFDDDLSALDGPAREFLEKLRPKPRRYSLRAAMAAELREAGRRALTQMGVAYRALPSKWHVLARLIKSSIVATAALVLTLVFLFAREIPHKEDIVGYAPALTTQFQGPSGEILAEFATERRIYATIDEIPERLQQAFISAEDKNFWEHPGFDARAIGIAFYETIRSGGTHARGASTITQQLLKNLALYDQPLIARKVQEIVLSNRLEHLLGKEKILELYLNEIFLGQNAYGVAAAAQAYYNKPMAQLEIHEAALIAALAQSPSGLHPVRNYTRLLTRRNYVLREMHENGYITAATFAEEVRQPIATVQDGAFDTYASALPERTYFTDAMRRQLGEIPEGEAFDSNGLVVRASIDYDLQAEAAKALRRQLERFDRSRKIWRPTGYTIDESLLEDEAAWRTALAEVPIARDIDHFGPWRPAVVLHLSRTNARIGIEGVENDEDGHWLSHAQVVWQRRLNGDGSRGRWSSRMSHLVREGEVIHVRAVRDNRGRFLRWSMRQVPELQGAFMAMEVDTGRVLAVQGGFSYGHSQFNRAVQAWRQPGSTFKPFVYASALEHGFEPSDRISDAPLTIQLEEGVWRPQNFSHSSIGRAPMRRGLELSRNLMTVRLAQSIGMGPIGELSERMGVYERMEPHIANSLGSQETTLHALVQAYGAIANGGYLVDQTFVDRIEDRHGLEVYRAPENGAEAYGRQVLAPETAYQLTRMMQGVVERGTAKNHVNLRVPTAGKTGTTNDARDVWFVGFTSNIVAGCYIGFDTPRTISWNATGGSVCGPVFENFMREAVRARGAGSFARAEAREGGDGRVFVRAD